MDALERDALGLGLRPGDDHYRAFVGPPGDYDLVAAMTFSLLAVLGCRQQHRVLDIGCGSLRVGRLLIPYLNAGGYTGLDPNAWLVECGISRETGQDQVRIKAPRFVIADNASQLVAEGARFDFIVAQSIFSHCGADLLQAWLESFAQLAAIDGTALVTWIEGPADTDAIGWVYPGCVAFTAATMQRMAAAHGLSFVPLHWRHPRQRWALLAQPGYDAVRVQGRSLGWDDSFDWIRTREQPAPRRG